MDTKITKNYEILGYDYIKETLAEFAESEKTKEQIYGMEPLLSEAELLKYQRETTEARKLLDLNGTPAIPVTDRIEEYLGRACAGELILEESLEHIARFLSAVRRLKDYLLKGRQYQTGLSFYSDNLFEIEDLYEEIQRCIRGGIVDDYASDALKDIRRSMVIASDKIKSRAETVLKNQKAVMADSFVVLRNGKTCVPVKKEYKTKVPGSVVDKSATGATLFIEPEGVVKLREDYELLQIEEENEVRRILYTLTVMVSSYETEFRENIRVILKLDFIFARGKLSAAMKAAEPVMNTAGHLKITEGRHPQLNEEECIPLNFEMKEDIKGVIITGPNTGGKTVSIKTVGLFVLMACSGLHVPCKEAQICMRNQVLCDIGDGQDINDNLSTFSAHIVNVIDILNRTDRESLVILDELGSGTDPAEGMGIAIAILEELRKSGCKFLVTTHYPEVKEYAGKHDEILSARMGFDRENLKPLYQLEMGLTGDSCALYIAKRLGLPDSMIQAAAIEAYGEKAPVMIEEILSGTEEAPAKKIRAASIHKIKVLHSDKLRESRFLRGDSVMVYPEKKIGIIVEKEDKNGNALVQIQKEKKWINHKRLKIQVEANQLYPPDYDFSILFDTVENRKLRHQMERKHVEGLTIYETQEGENVSYPSGHSK